MKPKQLPSLLILCLLLSSFFAQAQEEVNRDSELPQIEREEIIYSASRVIRRLSRLYYVITDENASPKQVEDAINARITPGSKDQLFSSPEVIIEDDIDPRNFSYTNAKNSLVREYLNHLDLSYEKGIDRTIILSNITTSNVKKTDYFYVRVFFEKTIIGKNKSNNQPYKKLKRVATVIAEKPGNKWKTYIAGISFYDPAKPIKDTEYDLPPPPIREESLITNLNMLDTVRQERFQLSAAIIDSITRFKVDSIRRLEDSLETAEIIRTCEIYVKKGDQARGKRQWDIALDYYYRANAEECDRQKIQQRINGVRNMISMEAAIDKDQYVSYVNCGYYNQKTGNYVNAIECFEKAFRENPNSLEIRDKLEPMEKAIRTILKVENDCEEDLKACINLISDKILAEPEEPHFYRARAEYHFKRGHENRALSDLDETIKRRELDFQARDLKARIYWKMSNETQNKNRVSELRQKALDQYNTILAQIDTAESVLFKRAGLYMMMSGNNQNAIEDYETILAFNNNSYNAHVRKGELHMKESEWLEAKLSFDRAAEIRPELSKLYYLRGLCQIKLDNVSAADAFFTQARNLKMNENQVAFLHREARNYYELAQTESGEKAIRLLTYAITINPDMHEGWALRGNVLSQQNRFEEAIRDYALALIFDKDNPEYLFQQGLAFRSNLQFREAVTNFNKAVELDPQLSYIFQLGDTHFILKQYQASLDAYLLGLDQFPDNPLLLYKAGRSYYETEKYTLANNSFTQSLSAKENVTGQLRSSIYFYRGKTRFKTGEYRKAMKDLRAAEPESSNPGEVHAAMADGFLIYRDYKRAEQLYLDAMQEGGVNSKLISHSLGKVFLARGEFQQAIDQFRNCLKDQTGLLLFSPDENPESYITEFQKAEIIRDLGLAYLYMGENQMALKSFSNALEINENDGLSHYGIACVLAQGSGSINEVVEELGKARASGQVNDYFIKNSPYLTSIKKITDFKALFKKDKTQTDK